MCAMLMKKVLTQEIITLKPLSKNMEKKIQLSFHIGEDRGYVASNNKVFIGREGVICNV